MAPLEQVTLGSPEVFLLSRTNCVGVALPAPVPTCILPWLTVKSFTTSRYVLIVVVPFAPFGDIEIAVEVEIRESDEVPIYNEPLLLEINQCLLLSPASVSVMVKYGLVLAICKSHPGVVVPIPTPISVTVPLPVELA
jgi:hypothetical protein